MTSTRTSPGRRCNAAPSGPGAPVHWRCARPAGHKGELHQTRDGGGWGPGTTFTRAAGKVMDTAEVAAVFQVNATTINRAIIRGCFGEDTVFITPGGHYRFHADKISAMVAAGTGPVLTVAQLAAMLKVGPKTIAKWERRGRFGEDTVFRTPGGHRRFYADKIDELIAAGGRS